MAQLFSILFFSLALVSAIYVVAVMLRGEWMRIVSILSGRELEQSIAAVPKVRVRQRTARPVAVRVSLPLRAAA